MLCVYIDIRNNFVHYLIVLFCYSYSWVHLDAGQYWTQRAAELTGTSHRQVFHNNISKLYKGLHYQAKNMNLKGNKNRAKK